MQRVIIILSALINATLSAQVSCTMGADNYTFPSIALCAYQFPSDTTEELKTYTYASISNDTLYYADVLTYKTECNSLLFVKVNIKDLKEGFYKIDEILLNDKTKVKGYLLSLSTPIGYNVFLYHQISASYGSNSVPGNIVNIICTTKESAENIVKEIKKAVPITQVY